MKDELVERLRSLLERRKMTGVAATQTKDGGYKLYENEAALYELRDLAPQMAEAIISASSTEERLREALDEIAHASWPSVNGDDPVKRIQGFALAALTSGRNEQREAVLSKIARIDEEAGFYDTDEKVSPSSNRDS